MSRDRAASQASTLKVIEYAGEGSGLAAAYAGWLLSSMGAEVTRVGFEPDRRPGATRSAISAACDLLAQGKHDADWLDDGDVWQRELACADLLLCDDARAIESLIGDRRGVEKSWPRLVVGIATPLGLDGPMSGQPASPLDAQALSGAAWSIGEPGRSPLSLPVGIVEHQTGAMLAAASLSALEIRDREGGGQLIDLAMVDVLASYVSVNCRVFVHHGLKWHRSGRRPFGSCGAYPFAILPCLDGDVCISGRTRDEWERLVRVMGHPAWASEPRYQDLRAMGTRYPEEGDALIRPWLADKPRAELESIALTNSLILSPLRSIDEVLQTEQFRFRGFLGTALLGDQTIVWPGLPFKAVESAERDAPDRADELLSASAVAPDMGGGSRFASTESASVDGSEGTAVSESERGPLSGIRVLDFGWVWSAPWVGAMLAELGADVIKVEHAKRPDNVRLSGKVLRDGVPVEGPSREMSPMYHQINHGKRGITLNLKHPRAVKLAHGLVRLSDLVFENMSPGSMNRSGLGYEVLRELNPRIVLLSMSAAGQLGPYSAMRAYAPTMSAFAGLESLIGYYGESPIGALNFAIGDPNATVHGLLAALAALRRARLENRGSHIDLSQVEALVSSLRVSIVQAQQGGAQPQPAGNRHPDRAPHGIYPAAGDDRWFALAIENDEQWRALSDVAVGQGFAEDARFVSGAGRLACRDEIDLAIARWTRGKDRAELVRRLRAAGVPASPVNSLEEMRCDPHLQARAISQTVPLPFYGPEQLFRGPWRFSRTRPLVDRPGPMTGQHNMDVFGGLLGLSPPEIAELVAEGVIA